MVSQRDRWHDKRQVERLLRCSIAVMLLHDCNTGIMVVLCCVMVCYGFTEGSLARQTTSGETVEVHFLPLIMQWRALPCYVTLRCLMLWRALLWRLTYVGPVDVDKTKIP
jgi:hypothetical protein